MVLLLILQKLLNMVLSLLPHTVRMMALLYMHYVVFFDFPLWQRPPCGQHPFCSVIHFFHPLLVV